MSSPTEPAAAMLAEGHWAGAGVCLDVTSSAATVGAGCGRGALPRPVPDVAGSFSVQGTFDVVVGPPPPGPVATPAQFTGIVRGDTLTMTIVTAAKTYGPLTVNRGSTMGCPTLCP